LEVSWSPLNLREAALLSSGIGYLYKIQKRYKDDIYITKTTCTTLERLRHNWLLIRSRGSGVEAELLKERWLGVLTFGSDPSRYNLKIQCLLLPSFYHHCSQSRGSPSLPLYFPTPQGEIQDQFTAKTFLPSPTPSISLPLPFSRRQLDGLELFLHFVK
jgi:hypothetical protein